MNSTTNQSLTSIADTLGRTIPVKAAIEISKLTSYNTVSNMGLKVRVPVIKEIPAVHPGALELVSNGEPFMLRLRYNMLVSNKRATRTAIANTNLYFRSKDNKFYRIEIQTLISMDVKKKDLDLMMFSCCYLYAKELLESIHWSDYTEERLELPVNYADIDQTARKLYDGYIEYRNTHDLTKTEDPVTPM